MLVIKTWKADMSGSEKYCHAIDQKSRNKAVSMRLELFF